MAVISGGSFSQALLPMYGKWFLEDYKDYEPIYTKIFEIEKMDHRTYQDKLAPGFGLPVSITTDGGAVTYDTSAQRYTKTYTAKKYGLGFIITKDMVDDGDAIITGRKFVKDLKQSMVKGKETLIATVLQNAFDSTYPGGDGKELCATDHPTQAGNIQNEPTTPSDLDEASVDQMYIDIAGWKNDRGLRLKASVRKLINPPQLSFEVARLLNTTSRVETANNDLNAVKYLNIFKEGSLEHVYLDDDADRWFALTDVNNGLMVKERRPIDLSTDNDFDTENAKYKSIMRFDSGWTNHLAIYGSPGA